DGAADELEVAPLVVADDAVHARGLEQELKSLALRGGVEAANRRLRLVGLEQREDGVPLALGDAEPGQHPVDELTLGVRKIVIRGDQPGDHATRRSLRLLVHREAPGVLEAARETMA